MPLRFNFFRAEFNKFTKKLLISPCVGFPAMLIEVVGGGGGVIIMLFEKCQIVSGTKIPEKKPCGGLNNRART